MIPKKLNGSMIETKDSWREKQRKGRHLTVGEAERAFNQLAHDMETFANEFVRRFDLLASHVGFTLPPEPVNTPVPETKQASGADL